ncbi:hypothetical protein HanHA89_Chr16g0642181 [Helianthus annuus]|nr:hypothetical protein HanHA89_Chr16g0642181 [Helianthus annuus]
MEQKILVVHSSPTPCFSFTKLAHFNLNSLWTAMLPKHPHHIGVSHLGHVYFNSLLFAKVLKPPVLLHEQN